MASKAIYAKTPSGGIQFISQRKAGEVRIPNYVYDIWMPLLGIQVIGVYAVYCRLEREHTVKSMSQNRLAKMMRVGTHALRKANALLEKCGFINVRQPQGHERQMHFTTEITVLDPPNSVSAALIDELSEGKYEPLSTWLVAKSNSNLATPEVESSNAGGSIQQREEGESSNANIASLELNPSAIASLGCNGNARAETASRPTIAENATVESPPPPIVYEGLGMASMAEGSRKDAQKNTFHAVKRNALYAAFIEAWRETLPADKHDALLPEVKPSDAVRHQDAIEQLKLLQATPDQVRQVVKAKRAAGKADYPFMWLPKDIKALQIAAADAAAPKAPTPAPAPPVDSRYQRRRDDTVVRPMKIKPNEEKSA